MITEGVQQTLTVLYPLYKTEVYQRREQMMRLTAFGSFTLIAMTFALILSPLKSRLSPGEAVLLGLAGVIWCGVCCTLILQQQHRHRLAKQVLIQIEQALGFYEDGLFTDHQALYPAKWKTAWLKDRSGKHYLVSLCSLTAVFLLALILV
jgi:membrane associated rhomboid family serine protease